MPDIVSPCLYLLWDCNLSHSDITGHIFEFSDVGLISCPHADHCISFVEASRHSPWAVGWVEVGQRLLEAASPPPESCAQGCSSPLSCLVSCSALAILPGEAFLGSDSYVKLLLGIQSLLCTVTTRMVVWVSTPARRKTRHENNYRTMLGLKAQRANGPKDQAPA